MSLPWVRLDSNIASHDKVLRLVAMRDGYRALVLYVCSLGYAGGHGTDGHVPEYAVPFLHGTERHADMLVKVGLWEPADDGWTIRNWVERQELAVVAASKRHAQRLPPRRTNCIRWHGRDCGCWDDDEGDVVPLKGRR